MENTNHKKNKKEKKEKMENKWNSIFNLYTKECNFFYTKTIVIIFCIKYFKISKLWLKKLYDYFKFHADKQYIGAQQLDFHDKYSMTYLIKGMCSQEHKA